MKKCYLLLLLLFACEAKKSEVFEETLVYLKSVDGNFDIYQNDVLGQWEKRLTHNLGWDWSPKWNAGLNKLVYYSQDTLGDFSVKALDVSSGQIQEFPKSDLLNFQLSPDGQKVFFISKADSSSNIGWVELEGEVVDLLTDTDGYNGRFKVSPNGEYVAFISDRTGSKELFLANVNSKNFTQLTDNDLIEKYISWSPDGEQIALTMKATETDKEDIYIINQDGSGLRQLTFTPYAEQEIAWSPSGKKIAFHGTTEADGNQIYTIDIADGKFTKITSGDFYHGEPAWLPFF